jgi:signal transduction histidine kinase
MAMSAAADSHTSRAIDRPSLHARLRWLSQALALAVAGLAALVLGGWILGSGPLDAVSKLLSMRANTAISLLLRSGSKTQSSDKSLDKTFERSLGRALRQTERLERLVRDLLDVSRISAGRLRLEPELVDLAVLVQEATERLEPQLKAGRSELSLSLPAAATGWWDRHRIEQVIDNLLANAIKFGAAQPIFVGLEVDDTTVRLAVRDHGIGIDAASRAKIFEPFERGVPISNYGGFGLGLWIAHQTVEASGGNIRVESERGAGSKFTVELPRNLP